MWTILGSKNGKVKSFLEAKPDWMPVFWVLATAWTVVCLFVSLFIWLSPSSYLFPSLLYLHKCELEKQIPITTQLSTEFHRCTRHELWAFSQWLESNQLVPYVYPKCPLLSDHSSLVQKHAQHKISTHIVNGTKWGAKWPRLDFAAVPRFPSRLSWELPFMRAIS